MEIQDGVLLQHLQPSYGRAKTLVLKLRSYSSCFGSRLRVLRSDNFRHVLRVDQL